MTEECGVPMPKIASFSTSDRAAYLATQINELRRLAAGDRLKVLAYLLDMAYVEACDLQRSEHLAPDINPSRVEIGDVVPRRSQ